MARDFLLVQLDLAHPLDIGSNDGLQAFIRGAYGTASGPTPAEDGFRLVLGIRSSGPLLGADW